MTRKVNKLSFMKSRERCKQVADQYSILKTFYKEQIGCYDAIRKNGWLDLMDHMIREIKPNNYWTKKQCKQTALSYSILGTFIKEQPACYSKIMKNNWESFLNHMISTMNRMGYWTEERCRKTILKFKTYKELAANYAIVLKKCRERGWCKDEIAALIRVKGRTPYWTVNRIQWAADQCDTLKELRANFPGAYNRILRYKSNRQYINKLKLIGNLFRRAIYIYEFDNGSVYIGLTCNLERRHIQHTTNGRLTHLFKKYSYKKISTGKYYSVKFAQSKEKSLISKYENDGWLVHNIAEAGGLGGHRIVHTRENVEIAVADHVDVGEFRKEHPHLYGFATRNGFWKEVSAHLTRDYKQDQFKIKEQEILKSAALHNSFVSFRKNNKRMYKAAIRRNIIEQVRALFH